MLCNLPCRIVLVVINSLTLLVGIALLIIGAIMTWGKDGVHNLLSGFITPLLNSIGSTQDAGQISELLSRILSSTAPIGMTLFCLGASFAILSAIGYCGACCNYKILLYLYTVLIGALALAVIIIVIVYFAKRDALGDYVVTMFATSVKAYKSMQANTVDSLVVGLIQPPLKCCGVDSISDFTNMSKSDMYNGQSYSNIQYPIPCCMMDDKYRITGAGCPNSFTVGNSYINQTCREPMKKVFLHYMNFAAYGLIAAFFVLVALIVFTILTIKVDVI